MMIHKHTVLFLLILTLTLLFFVSCEKATQVNVAEDRQAIRAVSKQYVDDFNTGNIAAQVAQYAKYPKILPPNNPIISGVEGIQDFMQAAYDAGSRDMYFTVLDLYVIGDMANVVGNYTITLQSEEGEIMSDSGKYMEIYKRQNNVWKLDCHIWNSSVPLSATQI